LNALALGARLGLVRLRTRPLYAMIALAFAVVAVVSLLESLRDRSLAADRALSGAAFGLCLPLLCFACFEPCFELALARSDLGGAVAALSRHGQPRPLLARGLIASAASINALSGAALGVLAVMLGQGFGHPRFLSDLVAVAWIGALTGAAYTGLFALASRWRRGRWWLLIADWLLGSGTGLLALPWPRGHARNLLGFTPVLELTQPSATLALFLLVCAGLFLTTQGLKR
jgi:hypothetical protein